LVTNAVVHGQPEISVRFWLCPERLTVAVADGGEAPLRCATAAAGHASGRGLVIVDALATRWGVGRSESRANNEVWFEMAT
jgi:anti-sigma regulatory factor (Ser/Thr protein kinase)